MQGLVLRLSTIARKERIAQMPGVDLKAQEILVLSRRESVLLNLVSNSTLHPNVQGTFVSRLEKFDIWDYVSDESKSGRKEGKPDILNLVKHLSGNPKLDLDMADRIAKAIVYIDGIAELQIWLGPLGSNVLERLLNIRSKVLLIADNLLREPDSHPTTGIRLATQHFNIAGGQKRMQEKMNFD